MTANFTKPDPCNVVCVVGTRPEAIKMAPVILALQRHPNLSVRVLATAQHRDMLDEALSQFNIVPDIDLDIMRPRQTLANLTSLLLTKIDSVLTKHQPDIVLAQGDTTTVFATALACFYLDVPFGHIEAGLRTRDFRNPFPEEMNRVFSGRLSTLHFAPTQAARSNLVSEGVPVDAIHVTGNTVIDAVRWMADNSPEHGLPIERGALTILMTCHRRENFGAPLVHIFSAVRRLALMRPEIAVIYPVHPNPNVAAPAHKFLAGIPNILLTEPLSYTRLVSVMKSCHFVLTDSGGLQEEAPALGKPVLVLRDETERPEAVAMGAAVLVGHDEEAIVREACRLIDNEDHYNQMARTVSPYGDGHAAERITDALLAWLSSSNHRTKGHP
jgi:UDP-N-acetylglucosamine 2-epimerase (non-hydrolysing)